MSNHSAYEFAQEPSDRTALEIRHEPLSGTGDELTGAVHLHYLTTNETYAVRRFLEKCFWNESSPRPKLGTCSTSFEHQPDPRAQTRRGSVKTVHTELKIRTRGRGFIDITAELQRAVQGAAVVQGICNVFVKHTSASLTIQENADPAVLRDLERWMSDLVPESRRWEHADEGPDDMPAHARSVLTHTSETLPIVRARLDIGTWQAVYLWEHRARPHERRVSVSIIGE